MRNTNFAELLWTARLNKTWLKAAMTDVMSFATDRCGVYIETDYLFELGTYVQVGGSGRPSPHTLSKRLRSRTCSHRRWPG